jgi:hypothetical protein
MGFLEIVGATAIGATAPVILARYLDRRRERREIKALSKTGLGRYMEWFLGEADKNAGELAEQLKADRETHD